jgi:hypothetical protein
VPRSSLDFSEAPSERFLDPVFAFLSPFWRPKGESKGKVRAGEWQGDARARGKFNQHPINARAGLDLASQAKAGEL